MSEHYFSNNPSSKHNFQEINLEFRGMQFRFKTDAGVFSKSKVDLGTKLLLKAVSALSGPKRILDLGCGYGVIGITVAKLFPESSVYMVDINERAVQLAVENAAANQVSNVIIKAGEGFQPLAGVDFHLILTNPPIRAGKQVIYGMVDDAYKSLAIGGFLAAVIMTRQGSKSLAHKMEESFGNVNEWEKGSGYRVLASQRRV